ncbi:hypothetical protein OG342_39545 [Streptomyces bobili]|uniref:hypothetical protein n=1 Tax=Streptomyces bobili TaxID=67280 RepID=UPI002257A846|nr:hypothetical protein [Streptomyces bobili]MCX5528874.1 hypothetical protein [Streptomyces bobili]
MVAGADADLDRAEAALRAADVLHQRVPVEYAYHSSLMDGVLAQCRAVFDGVVFAPPRIPWVSCVEGRLVERPGADHFWQVARRPIEFERTMAAMRARGDFLYLDLGPSGTLHNFVRGNLPAGDRSRSLPLLSPFGHDPRVLAQARTLAAPATAPPTTAITPPHPAPHPPPHPHPTPVTAKTARKAHGMKVYGFPGQGSQQRGMGKELFARYPQETAIADRVLGYSIEELCVHDPERRLGRTEYTQPALYSSAC